MILKSITPRAFGPFSDSTILEIAPTVTVLTGPNDVGKSLLLRLIALLCRDDQAGDLKESDVNNDAQRDFTGPWDATQAIGCTAQFTLTEFSKTYVSSLSYREWQDITVQASLVSKFFHRSIISATTTSGKEK